MNFSLRAPPPAAVLPGVPVQAERTLEAQLMRSMWQPVAIAGLAGLFGLLAAMLAAAGMFGTLTQTVRERRREFGVRLALGALPAWLWGSVVADGARPLAVGLAAGAVAGAVAAPMLRPWLFGVTPMDWVAWGAGAGLLAATMLLAAVFAGRKATCVDPVEALRAE